jgi:long-subunit acyl-CoA synthetase (AMP-forming)
MGGSSLRYFLYGAAQMSVEKLKRAIEVFGLVMMGGYGQTEAPTSISFLPPGATGEICVRGDLVMKGYRITDRKKDLRERYWQESGRRI